MPVLPDSLTVEEAVRLALERNYDVQIAAANLLAAQGRVWQSYRGILPSVSADASYDHRYSEGAPISSESGQLQTPISENDSRGSGSA